MNGVPTRSCRTAVSTVGSASVSATMGSAEGPADDTQGSPKFDVGSPDGGADCGDMGDGMTHSYIWIANSAQGTVSKINTQTLVEEGRYAVRITELVGNGITT
mgnify:CR=1 FL=1